MGDVIQRAVSFEMRSSGDGNTLAGYAAVFDSPTLIHERGAQFHEQISKGAFAKAINARERVVLQFDHGQHPVIGSMPLGRITSMEEDARGLYVEAELTDNWMVQPVRDAIAAGAVDGMSFRFSVESEAWDRSGDLPLRTISEVRLYELGPVVFPAYADTTVAVRSALHALGSDLVRQAMADDQATPDEGQPTPDTAVTPDEGQRLTPKAQRMALILPNLPKEK